MRRIAVWACAAALTAAIVLGVSWSLVGSAASSTPVAVPTARSAIRLAECDHCFTSIRHVSAKLMTLGDLEAAFPGITVPYDTTFSQQQFWVVAVSGAVNPAVLFSATVEHDTWAVSVLSRQTGSPVAAYYGADGGWPPWVNALPKISA